MKVVVTGSSGRLGRTVVNDLLANGHQVVPVDMRPPEQEVQGSPTRIADLTQWEQVPALMEGADAVAHLGNFPGFARAGAATGFANNVTTTFNVMQAATDAGVRHIVSASSIQAYGVLTTGRESHLLSKPQYLPIDEEHPLQPVGAYPMSKAMGEHIAEAFARRTPDLSVFSLRFTYLLSQDAIDRWVQWQKKMQDDPRPPAQKAISGFTHSLFTWIRVEDAARAVRLACEANRPGHTPLNIVSPSSYPEWSMELLEEMYRVPPPLRRPLNPCDALFDSQRAKEVLGFVAELPRLQPSIAA
jgi:nucleoside-diphosphate-sugar epimerase